MQIIKISLTLGLVLIFAGTAFAVGPRLDSWKVIGPGGGGSMYAPTISPHSAKDMLVYCDMTGAYISHDGGSLWRNFNLRGRVRFYLFDPVDPNTIYVQTIGLWRSTDRGDTWKLVHPDPATVTGSVMPDDHAGERLITKDGSRATITALAVDPGNSKTLYAAFLEDGAQTLRISSDWGKTWNKTVELPVLAGSSPYHLGANQRIFIDPKSPRANRTIYVIGAKSVSVRKDGGWRTGPAPDGTEGFEQWSAGFPKEGGSLVIYVTSRTGVFSSEDGGRKWRRASIPGIAVPVQFAGVATSYFHPDVAYASYASDRTAKERVYGIAKTSDRGRTWELIWNQEKTSPEYLREAWKWDRDGVGWSRNFENLGVAPTDPNICFGSDPMRTMRSSDGGKTWDAVYSARVSGGGWDTTGLDVTTTYGVHFDPFDKNRIFISYTDIGQYRSENGGKSWLMSTIGVPRAWQNTTYWMEFDPEVKNRVWAVMSYVHDLPRPKMWNNRSVSTYVGGLCRSDDGARNWKCTNDWIPDTAPTHILLDPKSSTSARVLYVAAFGKGVYKSTSGGDSWTLKNKGIDGTEPYAWRLAMDPKGVLYLIVARRSSDGSFGNAFDGALYRSTDGAEHWTKIPLPKGVNGPNGLGIDPTDPNRLYLAAWGRHTPEGAKDGGIFISENGGSTWRNVFAQDQHVYDITFDPRQPNVAYACGFESTAWRSTDRGLTWKRIKGYNFKWGHRVIPDPYDPAKIYITTFGGSVWHGPAKGDPNAVEDIVTPIVKFK